MNVDWIKIGKIASLALPIIGTIIGSVVGEKENKRAAIETTEKLFKEYIDRKK